MLIFFFSFLFFFAQLFFRFGSCMWKGVSGEKMQTYYFFMWPFSQPLEPACGWEFNYCVNVQESFNSFDVAHAAVYFLCIPLAMNPSKLFTPCRSHHLKIKAVTMLSYEHKDNYGYWELIKNLLSMRFT